MAEETQVCRRCNQPRPVSSFHSRKLYCGRCDNLRSRYGVTYREVKALWEQQNGACALCETPLEIEHPRRNQADAVHVDHCHTTNDIRGLLCRHCNLLLGHAKDRVVVLQAAIRYLRKSADCIPEGAASNEKDEDAEEDRHGDG